MAESKGSLTSGLTASINQTFKFGKIIVMATTLIVSTAWVLFFTWLSGKIPTKNWSLFLKYVIAMVGLIGAIYLMLSAMVAVVKMTAANASGKKMGFLGGFGVMVSSIIKVVFGTIVPIVVLVVAVGIIWGIGLLGAIPKFGPVFWGIVSIIPVLVALIAAFVLVKLILTIFLLPGVLAVGGEGGYKSYKEISGIIKTRLLKLLSWFAVTFILMALFFTIVQVAFGILSQHTRITMGPNSSVIGAGSMPGVLVTNAIQLSGWSLIPPLNPGFSGAVDKTIITGGWFFGIEYGIVLAVLVACGYIFFAIAGMHAYGALAAEQEDPIAFKVPVNMEDITHRVSKFKESVSEKVKSEMGEGETRKSKK